MSPIIGEVSLREEFALSRDVMADLAARAASAEDLAYSWGCSKGTVYYRLNSWEWLQRKTLTQHGRLQRELAKKLQSFATMSFTQLRTIEISKRCVDDAWAPNYLRKRHLEGQRRDLQ